MNRKKEQELQENLAFFREQFQADRQQEDLPQKLTGQALKRRLEHTNASPRPAASFRWAQWSKVVAMACSIVLVAVLARYSTLLGGVPNTVTDTTAENSSVNAASYDAPSAQTIDAEPEAEKAPRSANRDEVEMFVMDEGAELPTPEMAPKQVTPAEAESPKSPSNYTSYEELRKELLPQENTQNPQTVVFGGSNLYTPSKVRLGETVELTEHILSFGVDPVTGQESSSLYVTNDETGELQKEIILPDKKVADVILYIPDGENFAVLVAQRRTDTNLMVLSLNDLSTATYRLAGEYGNCWVKDDVLYTASFMEVDGGLVLEGRDYVPYYGAGQEKRLVGANWIYRLEDGQEPEQYTVLAQMDLNSTQMIAVAVLGGETEVNWRDDILNVTSAEDEDVSLRFSIQGLQFLKD